MTPFEAGSNLTWRDMGDQSTSVWSRGRYLTPCESRSCSTSSGIRPFTVIAYTPRTYLSNTQHKKTRQAELGQKQRPPGRTCSLPTRHPALFWVHDRDAPVEMCRRAGLNTIRRALHLNQDQNPPFRYLDMTVYLHDLLAVRTAIAPEVYGRLYDRAEETCT